MFEIRIQLPGAPVASRRLDRDVARIGSASDSDVIVATAPAHAASILRRGGYQVMNRCDRTMHVAGERLAPGQSRRWRPGDALLLPGGATLHLVSPTEPKFAASPKASSRPAASKVAPLDAPVRQSGWSGSRVAWVGMAVLAAWLTLGGSDAAPTSNPADTAFDAVVRNLINDTPPNNLRLVAARRYLQAARTFELRGLAQPAISGYAAVREILDEHRGSQAISPEVERRATEFVLDRLTSLGA